MRSKFRGTDASHTDANKEFQKRRHTWQWFMVALKYANCPRIQGKPGHAVQIEPGLRLPKTGIFQISAGDYRRFRSQRPQFRSPETDSQFAKPRNWQAFLVNPRVKSPGAGLPGWGGRIRTSVLGNQNPLPYHLATPQ